MSLSNDSQEGKLVSQLIAELGEIDKLGPAKIEKLHSTVDNLRRFIDGLGFCLSEAGDLLSQWRGYAGDGNGVSIGFSKEYLQDLSKSSLGKEVSGFNLRQVEYNHDNQKTRIYPTYLKIKELIEKGALNMPSRLKILQDLTQKEMEEEERQLKDLQFQLSLNTLPLIHELFAIKQKAFSEEREWRLISFFLKNGEEDCMFRSAKNGIIPYREYEIINLDRAPIVEIVLGPKNTTPKYVMNTILKRHNFQNVVIRLSESTYR